MLHAWGLAVGDVRHDAVLFDVHVETVLPEVLGDNGTGGNDARLLGEFSLAKVLCKLAAAAVALALPRLVRTVSLVAVSLTVLPTSLFIHSSVLVVGFWLGVTRGMLMDVGRC